jgi:2-(1,2-epoxy-1,2-dihydrophenyl)acetyl-CoA isomerase
VPEHAFTAIEVDIVGRVAVVTLERPEKLNAFNAIMQSELQLAFDRIEADGSVRAVILTGSGRAFSAGQDLIERRDMLAAGDVDLGAMLRQNYHALIGRIADLPVPVISAVNGLAAGAAAAIALGCDITMAARSASFQFPFIKVALAPDAGASWWLTRLLGPQRAMMTALTAGRIDAEEAARTGLIASVVDDAVLMDEAMTLARSFAACSRGAIAETKSLMRHAAGSTLTETLDAECEAQTRRGRSSDYREAIAAFAARPSTNS